MKARSSTSPSSLKDVEALVDGPSGRNDEAHFPSPPPSPPRTLLERVGGLAEEAPHVYTPESDEVERFLESVIADGPAHTCPGNLNKPALALDTHDPSAASYSPQTAPNSAIPALGDAGMPPLSASAIEECRRRLVPVLVASAHARGGGKRLDPEQCAALLSDDRCRRFYQQAKETRLALSQKTPVDQGWSGSPKRDRADEADGWVRNTRSRFGSTNTVLSDASRRDSDATLVDFPGGRAPPKAPRAMLQHQARASPTTATMATTEPAEFVSHMPSQPGTWFRQLGKRHAEIVDVDIDVGDDMFHTSADHRPSRLRMHVRLCSIPVLTGDPPAPSHDVDGAVQQPGYRWPKKGKLVVQVNPESERSKTWLPYALESDPLDVTSCICPGKNTFRFIQLSDLSEFAFALVASPPPPEEEWRSWDWTSLAARSSTLGDPGENDPPELAHVPVVVRS